MIYTVGTNLGSTQQPSYKVARCALRCENRFEIVTLKKKEIGKSPFIALVGIISNGEWRNDKNNATFPESVTKSLNILCDSLIAKSKKKKAN